MRYDAVKKCLPAVNVAVVWIAAMVCPLVFADFGIAGSSPELHLVLPRGIQRGTEQTLTLTGVRLGDAQTVFFYDQGITVKSMTVVDAKKIQIVVDVDSQCGLGQHVLQVHCRTGVSDFRTVYVGPFPEVAEKEPNNGFSTAEKIELGTTVTGVIARQDTDYYAVSLDAGQRLSVEVEAMRLGNFFDTVIALYDGDQNEIAVCDDTEIHHQDGFLSFMAPTDGDYFVMIRDATYDAGRFAFYRLHIGDFDRPNLLFPAGGKPGQLLAGEMLIKANPSALPPHDAAHHSRPFEIQLPQSEEASGPSVTSKPSGDQQALSVFTDGPSALPLRINDLDNVNVNVNVNDSVEVQSPPLSFQSAVAIDIPTAINGRLVQPWGRHYFKFAAKKNQKITFEAFAKRVGSPLDPILNVFNKKRKSLIGNDDADVKPDSQLVFDPPADGMYFLRVMDYLNRGGNNMVYRIECTPVQPTLDLTIKRNDRFSQQRMAIAVPQGSRFAAIVSAQKKHFKSDVKLEFSGLPAGVTATAWPLKSKAKEGPVVFESADNAAIDFRLVTVTAKKIESDPDLENRSLTDATASPGQGSPPELKTVFTNTSLDSRGPPNNSVYHRTVVSKLPVAVIDALPFSIEVQPLDAPLVRNGSAKVKVVARRQEGFKEKIRLQFPYRSPGIGTRHQIEMKANQTEIEYPINANKNAELGDWPFYVIATANVAGPAWTSSQLEMVQVQQPFCVITAPRCVGMRNETVTVKCEIETLRPFTGTATAKLTGLPPHVTVAGEQMFDQTTAEIEFELMTNANTPLGQHKNIIIEVAVPVGDGHSVARAGTALLQINRPAPMAKKVAQRKAEK